MSKIKLVVLLLAVQRALTAAILDVAPTTKCAIADELNNTVVVPCAGAQYPQGMFPRKFIDREMTIHLVDAGACDSGSVPEAQAGGFVVVRRGGCSFAQKTSVAWGAGFEGVVIVDHPYVGEDPRDEKDLLAAPNLQGLQFPAPFSNEETSSLLPRSPPSVVLVSDASLALLQAEARLPLTTDSSARQARDGVAVELSGPSETVGNATAGNGIGRRRRAVLRVEWSDGWEATDATSLYYDGIRLAKAGRFLEAARAHEKAMAALPAFKAPAYERANALLRGGLNSTRELQAAVEASGVLPVPVDVDGDSGAGGVGGGGQGLASDGRHELRRAYADMAWRAHARVFGEGGGGDQSSRSGLLHPVEEQGGPKLELEKNTRWQRWRRPRKRTKRQGTEWRVGAGLGLAPLGVEEESGSSRGNDDTRGSSGSGGGVVVVTVATDQGPELASLRSSVKACGFGELVVLGSGKEYGCCGGTKLLLMEEWLMGRIGTGAAATAPFTLTNETGSLPSDEKVLSSPPSPPSSLSLPDDTLVLFVDAYDVLLFPGAGMAGALQRRFKAMNVSALISGEAGCWPDPGVAPAYPWHRFRDHDFHPSGPLFNLSKDNSAGSGNGTSTEADSEEPSSSPRHDDGGSGGDDDASARAPDSTPFPYPNSGGYVGELRYLRRMLAEVMLDVRAGHLSGGGTYGNADDQRWLQRHWLRHPRTVALDVFGEVFVSLHRLQPTHPLVLDNSVPRPPPTAARRQRNGSHGSHGSHGSNGSSSSSSSASDDVKDEDAAAAALQRMLRRRMGRNGGGTRWSTDGTPPGHELTPLGRGGPQPWWARAVPVLWRDWKKKLGGGTARKSEHGVGAQNREEVGDDWGVGDFPLAVWVGVGERTAVAPIVVHGNGGGKRLFRVLSCQAGLYCKWETSK